MKKILKSVFIYLTTALLFIIAVGAYGSVKMADTYTITQNCGLDSCTKPFLKVVPKKNSKMLTPCTSNDLYKIKYNANVMLMNIIPVKQVNVKIAGEKKVIPCGSPFGVKIFTEGILVVGLSDIKTENGMESPAEQMGLKEGDIILTVGGTPVNNNEELLKIVESSAGEPLDVEIMRSTMRFSTKIQPVKSETDDSYRLGAWVRDSSAGIGTLTFYNPENHVFGGLGHGICDIDTGELLPLSHGDIVKASINGITKGTKGVPGELKGYFIESEKIGELTKNTPIGVYGTLYDSPSEVEPLVVAMKQQVQKGSAQIMTTVSGTTPKYYNIDIQSINYSEEQQSKNMIIKITDEELLSQTGGIIQGMSGSPIIQNGMLVGAVTHVFVNDPHKGYGIFAENMLPYLEDQTYSEYKKVS